MRTFCTKPSNKTKSHGKPIAHGVGSLRGNKGHRLRGDVCRSPPCGRFFVHRQGGQSLAGKLPQRDEAAPSTTGWAPTNTKTKQSTVGMFVGAHPVGDFSYTARAGNRLQASSHREMKPRHRPRGGLPQIQRQSNRLWGVCRSPPLWAIFRATPGQAIACRQAPTKR